MNDTRELLVATVNEIFEDLCTPEAIDAAKEAGWSAELWRTVEEAEFALIAVPEEAGGAGGDLRDAAVLAHAVGAYAAPVPLAEAAMMAGPLLAEAGLAIPSGSLAIAPVTDPQALSLTRGPSGWLLCGAAYRVPYGRFAARVVVWVDADDGPRVVSVDPSRCRIEQGTNLAAEPRDDLYFDDLAVDDSDTGAVPGTTWETLRRRGALMRAVQMGGALERVLALSIAYAMEREQFGRPIGRFQIVQQYLALVAAEVTAAKAAISSALEAAQTDKAEFAVSIAKIRAGQAADAACTMAHQIHGAIGFTAEHRLHHTTTRLWAWRDEFGNASEWSERLGRAVIAGGADQLWPSITD